MGRAKISGRKLYKGKNYNQFSMDQRRKAGLASSIGYLYLGDRNEKTFNLEKLEEKNPEIKNGKKGILNKVMKRSAESSRLRLERKTGTKQVRNSLKRETRSEIIEAISEDHEKE